MKRLLQRAAMALIPFTVILGTAHASEAFDLADVIITCDTVELSFDDGATITIPNVGERLRVQAEDAQDCIDSGGSATVVVAPQTVPPHDPGFSIRNDCS